MPSCSACKSVILFGGVRDGDDRYCNAKCRAKDNVKHAKQFVPDELVEAEAATLHGGRCPRCQGPGPVDVHVSHTCMSFLVLTRWKSSPMLSCASCATKRQLGALGTTLVLGWWGFPWGLIFTPTQAARNISGLISRPSPTAPSNELKKLVLHLMADNLARQARITPPPLNRGFEVIPKDAGSIPVA